MLSLAVKKFLARPLKDYSRYKSMTNDELWDRWERLPVEPPIWKTMKKHQKVCFILGVMRKRFAYWCDTGTGKTLLSIALALYFEALGEVKCVLVLVPNKINKSEWVLELEKHSPDTTYCVLSGSSENKWKQLTSGDYLLVIETYDGLSRMLCKLTKRKRKKGGKTHQLKPNASKIKKMQKIVDGLILDESTEVANPKALPFRLCRKLNEKAKILFPLSGTPHGRDPIGLWAQMFLVDQGATLGPNQALFRSAFYTATFNGFGNEYKFKKTKTGQLNKMLCNRSIRYEANKSDLPSVVPIVKEVNMSGEARGYYDKAHSLLIEARKLGSYTETQNAFLRARQISSGFLGYKMEDARCQLEFKENPKLELLLSIIDSVVDEHKVVVFHDFNYSGMMIARELKEMGIEYARLWGGTKDPDPIRRDFTRSKDLRVLILNSFYGGFGLNLQVARYGLYFESPVPFITRRQTQRRIERQYSEHDTVFLYDLLCRNTYDQRILKWHAEGGDLFKAIIDGKEKL